MSPRTGEPYAEGTKRRRIIQMLNFYRWCLVAEHCWDPVGLAIVEYACRFERLAAAAPGRG